MSLRALTGGVTGLKTSLLRVLTLALALEGVILLAPIATQIVVDQVLPTDDRSLLMSASIGFAALLVLQACLSAMRSWSLTVLGTNVAYSWSRNAFSHLLKLPSTYFSNRALGDIISRFESINTIQHTLTDRSIEVLLDGMMALMTTVVLVVYSPTLSIVPFVAFSLYCVLRLALFRAFRLANLRVINSTAGLQSFLVESIRGVQTIKLLNAVESSSARYANAAFQGLRNRISLERLNLLFVTGSSLILGLQRLLTLCLGAKLVLDGQLTVGALMVFLIYSNQLTERGAKLLDYLIEFRLLRLQAERLADIVLSAPESNVSGSENTPPFTSAAPSIELRNVSFRYESSDRYTINDCSFTVASGEVVAIIGPSGCGKTTLAKLILGLLEPESGQILIDGLDVRVFGKSRLRSVVSSVLEDDQVFTGSIEDNIHFFDPDADPGRVVQAAVAAEIHTEILEFPMRYQSLVGDLGSTLSAGQKQRLLLARALYRNPRVLILDEATSHLDVPNERLVCAALKRLNATRIMIAHRPQTITMADRVLELGKDGRVRDGKTTMSSGFAAAGQIV